MARTAKPGTRKTAEPSSAEPIQLGILKEVIGFRIRRIQNQLSRGFFERLHREDVRPGLFSSLALINANPGISQITLAREVGFNKATVVILIDSLERLKWAERRRAPGDRRRSALFITSEGEVALAELRQIALTNEARVRAALTPDELAQLFALLDKIYAVCGTG